MNTFKQIILRACSAVLVLVFIGISTMSVNSCDSYLNINTDPTRPTLVSVASLLPTVQVFTASAHSRIGLKTSLWSQQVANNLAGDDDTHNNQPTDWVTEWSFLYLSALTTADRLATQADVEKLPHYQGITKILQAINLLNATDTWENVPFSQAFKGDANFTPGYDTQQQIYTTINTLLRDANTLLAVPTTMTVSPGTEDQIYGTVTPVTSRIDTWRRLGNSLQARVALHLSAKGAQAAGQAALTALQAGALASNAMDCQFAYTGGSTNVSPIRGVANETTIGRIFSIWVGDYIVSMMNANRDPRLPLIARTSLDAALTTYTGVVNGAGALSGNTIISPSTWYAANAIQIMNYSEVKFIEAEARFLAAGGTPTTVGVPAEARTAVIEAVTANMTKMGVATSSIATYTQQLPDAATMRLSDIMMEKYKAMFLHPEIWTDMRRYNYDVNVYRNLRLPQNHNRDLLGRWIQRGIYPQTEVARNQAAFNANWQQRADFFAEPMWRDKR
jgi:hypothetical protein